MDYVLDTNICIYIAKQKPMAVYERFSQLDVGSVGMSYVTYGELRYGALKSRQSEIALARLDELISLIPVLPAHPQIAHHYASIRADLAERGLPIGNNDLWIAAHVRAERKILVSNNLREFGRVHGLASENWVG